MMESEITEIDEGERSSRRGIKKEYLRKMDEQLDLLWKMHELNERAKLRVRVVSNQDEDEDEGEKQEMISNQDQDEGEKVEEVVPNRDEGEVEGEGEKVQVLLSQGEEWGFNLYDIISNQEEWEINLNEITFKELIAKDNFAEVYKGFYEGQDVTVTAFEWREKAETLSNENILQRSSFKEKVSYWYKIDHPNILKLIGAKTDEAEFEIQAENDERRVLTNMNYVVVEYLCGETLKSFLSKYIGEKKLPLKRVVQLALDLARGLACLHSRKLTHGNVKPENMLLSSDFRLKITDFGTFDAQIPNPEEEFTCDTHSINYMAPEVIDSKPYDKKCDIYSFGICLWEIYSCDMPYPDLSFSELTSAIFYQKLRPIIPEDCPKALANLMEQCWDSDPSKRPDMEQVVSKLEAIDTSKANKVRSLHSCFCFHK